MSKLNKGDQVSFMYMKEVQDRSTFPVFTNYEYEAVTGTVVDVRDLRTNPLQAKSVNRRSNVPRSQYMITVRMSNGKIKNFYHSRMFDVVNNSSPARQTLLRKLLTKMRCGV